MPSPARLASRRPDPARIPGRRRGLAWHPAPVESLEGRALLSVSPLDPAFNGGVAIIAADTAAAPALNNATAVATQKDGKVVVIGNVVPLNESIADTRVIVRRFNVDGTPDATFGTGGQATVALPAGSYNTATASSDVLIQADGKIVLSASLGTATAPYTGGRVTVIPVEVVVARLTKDGLSDTTFGTGGNAVIAAAGTLSRLALQPTDGKILVAGVVRSAAVVTRLDTTGSIDPTFHGGTLLTFDPGLFTSPTGYGTTASLAGLLATPGGKVDVVWGSSVFAGSLPNFQVVQLNGDGTADTSYGIGGTSRVPVANIPILPPEVGAAALQTDGRIVLAGTYLVRLNPDGSQDPSLRPLTLPITADTVLIQPDGRIVVGGESYHSSSSFAAQRYTASGAIDPTFGVAGRIQFAVVAALPGGSNNYSNRDGLTGLAVAADGGVVAVGTATSRSGSTGSGPTPTSFITGSALVVTQIRANTPASGFHGDYDGDNRTDVAAQLTNLGIFAVRPSNGGPDVLSPFGAPGVPTITVTGDYDGDGIADIAAYIPAIGVLAYRPSSGGPDVYTAFGSAGPGASIPVAGDYDGDGRTDVAVYLPARASFAIHPSGGGADYYLDFGIAGPGQTIPVTGFTDNSGRTEIAAYIPALGALVNRVPYLNPFSPGGDALTRFGSAGFGASIPAVGDYDGDGQVDVAVYLPASGAFAIQPASGRFNLYPSGSQVPYMTSFGISGSGRSIPAPGDYDGDGKTDLAVYVPELAVLVYRPSSGGGDMFVPFGAPGAGATIPATSLPSSQVGIVTSSALRSPDASAGVFIPLADDATPGRKKGSPRLG